MNENIDLAKILKNCPTCFELYSSVYGKVKFVSIDEKYTRSWIDVITEKNIYISFTSEGKLSTKHNGECVLFPSKDQRDWSKFSAPWYKKEKFDPKILKPFDRVICKNGLDKWHCDFFSSYMHEDICPYVCISGSYIDRKRKAPEDFTESRTDWDEMIDYADEMASFIKEIMEDLAK